MENMPKTKKQSIIVGFIQVSMVTGGGGNITKLDDPDWTFQTYMSTNLDYAMLCEPTISDDEDR